MSTPINRSGRPTVSGLTPSSPADSDVKFNIASSKGSEHKPAVSTPVAKKPIDLSTMPNGGVSTPSAIASASSATSTQDISQPVAKRVAEKGYPMPSALKADHVPDDALIAQIAQQGSPMPNGLRP